MPHETLILRVITAVDAIHKLVPEEPFSSLDKRLSAGISLVSPSRKQIRTPSIFPPLIYDSDDGMSTISESRWTRSAWKSYQTAVQAFLVFSLLALVITFEGVDGSDMLRALPRVGNGGWMEMPTP